MQKLLKLVLLITIVLLSCSTSWSKSNQCNISSTGEVVVQVDSVLISYDDLRTVNSKMIELKYEKEINDSLRSIIANDAIIIRQYKTNVSILKEQVSKANRQRNIVGITGVAVSVLSIIALIVK